MISWTHAREIIKPEYQQPIDPQTLAEVTELLENNLRLMHPFTPSLQRKICTILIVWKRHFVSIPPEIKDR
jgi:hypothetical protein